MSNPLEENHIETNGVKLHCMIQEAEEQPRKGTIILLHGFPEFWYGWRDQIEPLARQWRVVVPDMRGYNLSSKPTAPKSYTLDTMVPDMVGLIDALGEEKVVMAAHDWGGMVAWTLAMLYPQRLRKLIILNAAHPMNFQRELFHNTKQQEASQYILTMRSPDAESVLAAGNCKYLRDFVFGTMSKPQSITQEETDRYIKAWTEPGAITGMVSYYREENIAPPDLAAIEQMGPLGRLWAGFKFRLEGLIVGALLAFPAWKGTFDINVPTLVLWGMKDCYLMPEMLDGLERWVPDLKLVRIPDSSHWITHDAADQVTSEIAAFIADA